MSALDAPWLDDEPPARPLWLMTLADLALLLVGCFVLLQATQVPAGALAAGIRHGFGGAAVPAAAAAASASPAPMPVALAAVTGFAPGAARPENAAAAIAWARAAARDPRTRLQLSGEVDGSAGDVDPLTGSATLLAADRARAVAALLIRSGAIPPDRIALATARGGRRVVLTLGYDGGRQ
jgi:hypothetical protein